MAGFIQMATMMGAAASLRGGRGNVRPRGTSRGGRGGFRPY